jgi:hypothetical protein
MVVGCGAPDPSTVRGALEGAARALEREDSMALYRYIDRRARAALFSIVKSRRESARLIAADYPLAERHGALSSLGDAATVPDAERLFAKRCSAACRAELARVIGAPVAERSAGEELEVETTRGRLRLFRGRDGRYGIVWQTQALSVERTRASRELLQIRANAEVYRRRRTLEQGNP